MDVNKRIDEIILGITNVTDDIEHNMEDGKHFEINDFGTFVSSHNLYIGGVEELSDIENRVRDLVSDCEESCHNLRELVSELEALKKHPVLEVVHEQARKATLFDKLCSILVSELNTLQGEEIEDQAFQRPFA